MNGFVSASIVRSFPSIASMALSAGVAVVAVVSGWNRRDVRTFVAATAVESAWLMSFLLEALAPSVEAKLFWDAFHWPLMLATNAAYVLFSFAYIEPAARKTSKIVLALLFVPVLMATLAAIAAVLGYDGFLYARVNLPGLPFAGLNYRPSAFATGMTAYGFALLLAAFAIVARHAFARVSGRRKGELFVMAGLVLLLAGDVSGTISRAPFGSIWASPLLDIASKILLAVSLFSERMFGSLTKARRAVMDTLLDPVFVLGKGDEVVDCNCAARTLLGARAGDPIGESALKLFEDWPSSVTAALGFSEAETELDLPDRDGVPRRSYRVTVASNSANDRSGGWKLLVFNDITGQKSDARDMAATNEELEFWVRQRTAALRLEVAQRTAAEEGLRELNVEMAKTQREILWTLSEVVESRSRETAYHVVRVGEYARVLCQGYGMSAEDVEIITAAAPMHDVGKIAIPDAILSKPGALTAEERQTMMRHTVVGKEILGSSLRPLLRAAAVIAFEHHERWDGKGYPEGKSGNDISLSGRIVSLCDVFDALYTKRVYKEAWPLDKVLELFKSESGQAFEPRLVEILFDNLDEILDITKRFEDAPAIHAR